MDFLTILTLFALAIFVGFEIITKVPPTLHTPLMSGSNAISGITVIGAILAAGSGGALRGAAMWLGLAAVIFAIGLYFANLAYKAVAATGANQANFIGRAAQIAIVVFAAAIALREVGVANEIISMAFGITLFAIGLAVALAFGLGSKEIAGRELDNFLTMMRGPKDQAGD